MMDIEATAINKTCNLCKEIKPVECYYKQSKSKDGRGSNCKRCASESSKQRYLRVGREKRERTPYKYGDIPENTKIEMIKEYHKKYYEDNRDRLLSYQNKYNNA